MKRIEWRRWIFSVLLAATLLGAAGVASAQAATAPHTFYVDPNYFFDQFGTALRPYRTIRKALEQVVASRGDTIVVRPGSYDERLLIPPNTTLVGEGGAGETSIQGDITVTENLVALTEGAVLEGFTLGATLGNCVLIAGGMSAEVRNCAFFGSGRGIAVDTGATLHCYNNTFHANDVGLSVEATGNAVDVRNNIFSSNGVGIYLAAGANASTGYNCFSGDGPPVGGGTPDVTDFRAVPSFVDAGNQNFHLTGKSALKDNGDPAAEFNDVDGSPNDLGQDGGPSGQRDFLAPYIAVEVSQPAKGFAPYRYLLDASNSFDYWGILEIAWDQDASDGLTYDDAFGETAIIQFSNPGRYVMSVRAIDQNGWESEKHFVIDTGDALASAIYATKRAGAPPLRADLGAMTSGDISDVVWDLGFDGVVDAHKFTTTYILPEDSELGTHFVALEVQRTGGKSVSQAVLPLTLTAFPVIAVQPVAPTAEANIVATSGGALGGTRLDFQRLSLSTDVTAAIAEPDAAALPAVPAGHLVALVEFGPSDRPLARRTLATVPLTDTPTADAVVKVYRRDEAAGRWSSAGIQAIRLTDTAKRSVIFETSQLGTFAVIADQIENSGSIPPVSCNNGGKSASANTAGDLGVMAALVLGLFVLAQRYRRREA